MDSALQCLADGERAVGRYLVIRTLTAEDSQPVVQRRSVLSGPGIEHEYWLDEAVDSRKLVPAGLRLSSERIDSVGSDCNYAERFVYREQNGDYLAIDWLVNDQMPKRLHSVTSVASEEWVLQERYPASSDISVHPESNRNTPAAW